MSIEAIHSSMAELMATIRHQQQNIMQLSQEITELRNSIHKNHIEKLYTVPEVAKMLKFTERHVRILCTGKNGKPGVIEYILIGNQIRIRSSKLQEYLNTRCEKINNRSVANYHPRNTSKSKPKSKTMSP